MVIKMNAKKIEGKELVNRVKQYLQRAEGGNVPKYDLGDIADYEIIGGSDDEYGRRKKVPGLFRGRFVDVVAYAVSQPEYFGWYITPEKVGSSNNGHVQKYVPPNVKDVPQVNGLVEAIETIQLLKDQYQNIMVDFTDITDKIKDAGVEP
jgi:hypothetical protein